MNLAYLVHNYYPDDMTYDIPSQFAQVIQARGHSVRVITPLGGSRAGRFPPTAVEEGIPVERLAVDATPAARLWNRLCRAVFHYDYFLTLGLAYNSFLDRHPELDVVHAEGGYPFGAIAALAHRWRRRRGKRTPELTLRLPGADVLADPRVEYGYPRYGIVRRLLPLAFREAKHVRSGSSMTTEAALRFGARPDQIVLLPYPTSERMYLPDGCDLAAYRRSAREAIRSRLGLRDGFWIGALARLHPFKGLDYLVRAVPLLHAAAPEATVIIVGPSRRTAHYGDYGDYLKSLARQLGVADIVVLPGPFDHTEAGRLLAALDVVVVPSVLEATSRVIFEAGAVGTPSVITRTTGNAEYVREAGAGLVIESENPAALAAALMQLYRDADARAAMGRRAFQLAQSLRGPRLSEQWIEVLEHDFV